MVGVEYFNDDSDDNDSNDEEQQFDITLTASHSYMGGSLSDVSGRAVLEAGWAGRVPARAHHGVVFPGETVPMLLHHASDAAALAAAIRSDRLFGLLCPADSSCRTLSGHGVLCEVFEAALGASSVSFKARALHRFRATDLRAPVPYADYLRVRPLQVAVLPDVPPAHPLRRVRPGLAARPPAGAPPTRHSRALQRLDAAVTPWPRFVFEIYDYAHMRDFIHDYFRTIGLESLLPEEPVALSFWVAANLTVSARARLQLFTADAALQRLCLARAHVAAAAGALRCARCGAELARRAAVFAMSSAGVRSNYTNPGGHVHDVLTVAAAGLRLSGARESEYSWFPGYAWTVAECPGCMGHVGWRFDALRRNLRPQRFYGLCRNHVQPADDEPPALDAAPPPSPPPMV